MSLAGRLARVVTLGAALLLAGAGVAAEPMAGRYVLKHVEMASHIELGADGRFAYAMSYGALDESGAGTWVRQGDAVMLTSAPPLVPPRFAVVSRKRDPAHAMRVAVRDGAGKPLSEIDVAMEFDNGDVEIDATKDDGSFVLPHDDARRIVKVTLGLAMYEIAGESLKVTPADNDIAVRFDANDLGKAEFKGTRLRIAGNALIMPRFGEDLRYERADPR